MLQKPRDGGASALADAPLRLVAPVTAAPRSQVHGAVARRHSARAHVASRNGRAVGHAARSLPRAAVRPAGDKDYAGRASPRVSDLDATIVGPAAKTNPARAPPRPIRQRIDRSSSTCKDLLTLERHGADLDGIKDASSNASSALPPASTRPLLGRRTRASSTMSPDPVESTSSPEGDASSLTISRRDGLRALDSATIELTPAPIPRGAPEEWGGRIARVSLGRGRADLPTDERSGISKL